VLVIVFGAAGYLGYRYVLPWWKAKPPAPSGGELKVHVLDVGPIEGDSILIISPVGKSVLIDAGDAGKGKVILEALKRYNVQQLDYFIASHPHPDHIGGADEVLKAIKVVNVLDNGLEPAGFVKSDNPAKSATPPQRSSRAKTAAKSGSITRFYEEYKAAVGQTSAHYEKVEPGKTFDLGGGARLTVLAPSEPVFTREQMKSGGNEPNANSVAVRLDYGEFSMLLPGDAEEQTEHRLLTKDLNLRARVLKVAHHGSRYATSEEFVKRVKPEVAIISCGVWNRYGHPAQAVLDRLQAANVKLYRTDLQGEITITTRGRANDYVVKTAKEGSENLWVGRVGQKDDSTRAGFVAYGDFGPPPKSVNRK